MTDNFSNRYQKPLAGSERSDNNTSKYYNVRRIIYVFLGSFIIGCFGAFYIWRGLHDLTLSLEAFNIIQRAASFPYHFQWSHPFYPLGYPLLLRFFYAIIGDYRIAGNFLSTIEACVILVIYYRIAINIGVRSIDAWLSVLLLGFSNSFVSLATCLLTDMSQLLFLILAIWLLLRGEYKRHYFLAGLILGFGYLIRYTAIVFVFATLIWVLSRKKWKLGSYLLLGFILGASPQLIISFIKIGNPLYSKSFISNIALGLAGGGDLWISETIIAREPNLVKYILHDPVKLAYHAICNFRHVIFSPAEWTGPYIALVVLPGVVWAFFRSRANAKLRLMVFWWLIYVLPLSMAYIQPRYLLPILPITYLFLLIMLLNWNVSRNLISFFLLILVILEGRWFALSVFKFPLRCSPEVYVMASETLNKLGVFYPSVNATLLNPACTCNFYYLQDPLKRPIPVTTVFQHDRKDPKLFKEAIKKSGYRYVIIGECDRKRGLEWLDYNLPVGFRWVAIYDAFSILEIIPDDQK